MALDPREFQQRRRRRQQQLEQKRKRRKLILLVAVAVGLMLAIGIGIFVLAGSNRTEEPDATTTAPAETDPSGTQPPTEGASSTVVHFAAAGDLNITDRVIGSGGAGYDYNPVFMDVAHLLADADIAAVNFEGNLCDAPYGNTKSAPVSLVEALDNAGVDLLQLANSYSINFGMSGLSTTIDRVRSSGIEPLGVYGNQAEYDAGKGFTICEVSGVKIAFVAFTKGMDGLALPPGNENCVNVLYTDYATTYQEINTEGITAVLSAIEENKPDITIAMLHWGSEYNDTISQSQEDVEELFMNNGVDAIIGTHSHYLHKIDFNPATGKFVAYSLGDFLGDAQQSGSEYSVILDLEITKNNVTGVTKITNFHYTPIFTVVDEDGTLRVVRIQEAMSAYENDYIGKISPEVYESMAYALKRIEARIKGE